MSDRTLAMLGIALALAALLIFRAVHHDLEAIRERLEDYHRQIDPASMEIKPPPIREASL